MKNVKEITKEIKNEEWTNYLKDAPNLTVLHKKSLQYQVKPYFFIIIYLRTIAECDIF